LTFEGAGVLSVRGWLRRSSLELARGRANRRRQTSGAHTPGLIEVQRTTGRQQLQTSRGFEDVAVCGPVATQGVQSKCTGKNARSICLTSGGLVVEHGSCIQ